MGTLKRFGAAVAIVGLAALVVSTTQNPLVVKQSETIQRLKLASVTLGMGDGSTGSGVAFHHGDNVFIWTAAHVLSGTMKVERVTNPLTGDVRQHIWFPDVELRQEVVCDGRKVGWVTMLAKVLRYSDKHDLAILIPYAKWPSQGVVFSEDIPTDGEWIFHVGSLLGKRGATSVLTGSVSSVGRLRGRVSSADFLQEPLVYDQVALPAQPGSSGGGVFTRSGECIGLVNEFLGVSGAGHSHGAFLISPTRRMREFATACGCLYAIDTAVPVPKSDEGAVFSDEFIRP
jgi:S1-C subfamily serine protease